MNVRRIAMARLLEKNVMGKRQTHHKKTNHKDKISHMKKTLMALTMLLVMMGNAQAQEIYKEVKRMQKSFATVKYDKAKSMDERRVASFKWDAIEYMLLKANDDSTFTEKKLGEQTIAMTDFVNLYFKRLAEANTKSKREIATSRFKNASINNSLFNDMDKDLVLGYYNNAKFPTPFSLDTDWVNALKEIRSKNWH